VENPSLGDYIIKLPNPDNISDEYVRLFHEAKSEEVRCQVSYEMALQFYTDMFKV
jgi:hypothetical protein